MNESEKQFSFTRAASSTSERANNQTPITYKHREKPDAVAPGHQSVLLNPASQETNPCYENESTSPTAFHGSVEKEHQNVHTHAS
jgi:hypothetical protein